MAIIVINPYQYAAPIGPSADPYSDYVSLLLHGNGANNSTTFIDSSSHGHTVTANGDAEISTTQSKFGGSSMYFDGNGDYLTLASDASFAFGTGEFTIEFWVYILSASGSEGVVVCGGLTSNSWQIGFNSNGGIDFKTGSSGTDLSSAISLNTWHHFAVARDSSNTARMFLNGTIVDSSTVNTNLSNTNLKIGRNRTNQFYFDGYIDDLRITKGVARYTSNFNPPTAELFDPSDPDFSSVSLLLHGDGTNGSTTFIDSSNNSHAVTANGDAEISTTQSKFGGSSIYIDGTGDYLSLPDDQSAFNFGTGDFTIECWIYWVGGSYGTIFSQRHDLTTEDTGMSWRIDDANDVILFFHGKASEGSDYFYTQDDVISKNTWTHIALTRNGNTFTIWVNGQSEATNTSTISMIYHAPVIGRTQGSASEYLNAYLDDFRITKGVARYTSNFTPPTAPLPDETVVTNGLVLHLDAGNSASYPGSGTVWTDLSGNGTNGALTNGPTYDSSDGGSIVFDGDNDFVDLGTIGVSHPLQLNNGFTISWWGIQGGGGDLFQRIIDKSSAGVAEDGWAIYPRGQTTPESQLTLNYNGTDGTINSSTNLSSTSWQNWSLTWSSSSDQWIWYLNGSVDNSGSTTYNVPNVETNARIGSWNHSTEREYKGKISSVLIYTRPLTASEIAKNYNVLRDRYGL